jgi:hypothetical protein
VRDRLSILAESDISDWLNATDNQDPLDIQRAVRDRDTVYFRLDADRRPLLAAMLAAAIVSDLVTLVASLQTRPVPTVVMIDEFSAVAAEQVARLFGRARSAGVSLILGTRSWLTSRAPEMARYGSKRWGTSRRSSLTARTCRSPPS